jgi:hypothetical protein
LTKTKILFLSLYESGYSRSSVHIEQMNPDHLFLKIRLQDFKSIDRIRTIRRSIAISDAIWVMSPSHILVIPIRFLTRKSIILDAGWPLSDSTMTSNKHLSKLLKKIHNVLIDFVSFHLASRVILESNVQINKVSSKYILRKEKLKTIYTGVKESRFQELISIQPKEINDHSENHFVLFRGKYNMESGVDTLIDIIKNNQNTSFVMAIPDLPNETKIPSNAIVIKRVLMDSEIKWLYEHAVLALGQFGFTKRQQLTIPHKYFEAAYFGCPYLSPESIALDEISIRQSYIRYQTATSLAKILNEENLEELSRKSQRNYFSNLSNKNLSIEKQKILEDLG